MSWEVVIGLETHTQLSTRSKIFSGASTAFGAPPNTQASAIDIALPGVLPVLNKGAVERAIRFGLAVGGTINKRSVFARKNYFYPDLPKGYQISQYEIPVVQGGSVTISTKDGVKAVRLTRAHLEEDAGKSLHEGLSPAASGMTGIDLNRAGTPLLEIVSEPDIRSAEEAIAYAKTLHTLVRWIGICDGNMQEGNFRCDANVSVRKSGEAKLGTRCEIKNLNSFRFLQHAIEFEIRRQIELIEDGGTVVQETRLYDPERDETRSMRTKEDAQDYRYFPDPDLPPLVIDEVWIERVKSEMPELQAAMKLRLEETHGLTEEQATAVTASQAHAAYYHELAAAGADPKDAANFMRGPLAAAINAEGGEDAMIRVPPSLIAALLHRVSDNTISATSAVGLFGGLLKRYFTLGVGPIAATESAAATIDEMIEEGDLKQISDASAIGKIVDDVIAANASIVAEYKAGREKALNSLVGKVMAATQGKANPAQVNAILKKKLSSASA